MLLQCHVDEKKKCSLKFPSLEYSTRYNFQSFQEYFQPCHLLGYDQGCGSGSGRFGWIRIQVFWSDPEPFVENARIINQFYQRVDPDLALQECIRYKYSHQGNYNARFILGSS